MASADPLHVIQITDIHLKKQPGSRIWGVDVDACLQAVLDKIRSDHPHIDFVLVTGDLVGDEPDAYERLDQLLASLNVPVYCLPGNHDFPAAMSQILCTGWVQRVRYVAVGGWQCVLLDSSFPNEPGGHLARCELDLLDTVLATNTDLHTLVCLHHNPVPTCTPWMDTIMLRNGDALFAVLDRYPQVRAVVWGHIHSEYASRRGALQLLGTPATCVQFKPHAPEPQVDDLAPGYRWLTLCPDGRLQTGVERIDISAVSFASGRPVSD